MRKGKIIIVFSFVYFFGFIPSQAQPLRCDIEVNWQQIQEDASTYHLNTLPSALEAYVNDYHWNSSSVSSVIETIRCKMQIIISSHENHTFKGRMVVSSFRPIYHSVLKSVMVLINDEKIQFTYRPGQVLRHEEEFFDDLTSVLDYYAYLILAIDFDSFSNLGGTRYYEAAKRIVDLARGGSGVGWVGSLSSEVGRSIYVNDILDGFYENFRRGLYEYHRLGLDLYVDNKEEAQKHIIYSLEKMEKSYTNVINKHIFNIVFNAKSKEYVSVLNDASTDLKQRAYDVLSYINSANLSAFEGLGN